MCIKCSFVFIYIAYLPFYCQVHVLKRMGGMQENCHTCRLLDVGNVKGMSQHYGNSSSLPSSLESLCKNELPKGRKGQSALSNGNAANTIVHAPLSPERDVII